MGKKNKKQSNQDSKGESPGAQNPSGRHPPQGHQQQQQRQPAPGQSTSQPTGTEGNRGQGQQGPSRQQQQQQQQRQQQQQQQQQHPKRPGQEPSASGSSERTTRQQTPQAQRGAGGDASTTWRPQEKGQQKNLPKQEQRGQGDFSQKEERHQKKQQQRGQGDEAAKWKTPKQFEGKPSDWGPPVTQQKATASPPKQFEAKPSAWGPPVTPQKATASPPKQLEAKPSAWGPSTSQQKPAAGPPRGFETKPSAWGPPPSQPKTAPGPAKQVPPGEMQKPSHKEPGTAPDPRVSQGKATEISKKPSISAAGRKPTPVVEYTPPTGIVLAKGTAGRRTMLEANYLDLNIQNMIDKAYQYDVTFEPETPKKLLRDAFKQFCKLLGNEGIGLAFDGNKIVYSPHVLSKNALNTKEVQTQDLRGGKTFKITLQSTGDAEIELSSLKTYQNTRIWNKPMRAVQCVDVVMASAIIDSNISVRAGRSYYVQPDRFCDLRDGYELWTGLFQAAILGDKPYLNVDVCHKAFPRSLSLINWLRDNTRMRVETDDLKGWDERNLVDFLKGIDIEYTPPRELNSRPRTYRFNSLKNSCDRQTFIDENQQTLTVKDYFAKKGVRLQYPRLPCIHVGPRDRTIYIPLEFCSIPGGQATNKKAGANQVRELIRYAATSTSVRKEKIFRLLEKFDYNRNITIRKFNISLGTKFIQIDARILDAPDLVYSTGKVLPRDGKWDDQAFLQPSPGMIKWAILNTDNRMRDDDIQRFAKMFLDLAGRKRMNFDRNYALEREFDTRRLEDKLKTLNRSGFSFVVVVISDFSADSYPNVKKNAEIKCGVLTQCIKSGTVSRKCNVSTVSNILLKVNAKLNGMNHRIIDDKITSILANEAVMFIGADVTHPSPGEDIPSVVGVASSFDPAGFKYCMRWRLQTSRLEIIQNMDEIISEQLIFYQRMNGGKLPTKLIYYRDGVSDGQITTIRTIELNAMESAYVKISKGRKPIMICFVVQKRHRTRFFPLRPNPRDKFENVDPGTIVDKTITHPAENQFFLVSHKSIQGVAKPTKYIIIRDDTVVKNPVNHVNELQAMTYNLCHMFTRCNRTVSYPAPTYYAHLAAYRGRVYIHGERLDMRNLNREYDRRQINMNLVQGNPMYFV